jgi:hypothetical protein
MARTVLMNVWVEEDAYDEVRTAVNAMRGVIETEFIDVVEE